MAFPVNPTNGQQATVNGVIYTYVSAIGVWSVTTNSGANVSANNISSTSTVTVGTNLAVLGSTSLTGNATIANITAGNISANVLTANTLIVGGDLAVTGNVTGPNLTSKTTGSWTVVTGTNTYSFTVPVNGTYQIWVRGNIPNGIITYVATAAVTNNNAPVAGVQYAWVYSGGGSPIDFTSIPNQFTGTGNTIVRSSAGFGLTTNKFDFGISNSSGSSQTVYWGYVTLN